MTISASERTRASTEAFRPKGVFPSEDYRIHRHRAEVHDVTEAELHTLTRRFRHLTWNGTRVFRAVLALSIEDRGNDQTGDRGFIIHSFTRADLARRHRPDAPSGPRLYPADVEVLDQLVTGDVLTWWREPLRQREYMAADGTVLRYKASYQLRYRMTPAAAVFALLASKARPRVEAMRAWREGY